MTCVISKNGRQLYVLSCQFLLKQEGLSGRMCTSGVFFVGLLGFGFCKAVLLSPLMYFSQKLSLLSTKNIIKVRRN